MACSSWSSGLWPMAIFFSRIFRLLALLLENAAHVVEKRSGGGEDGAVHPVQKKLGVLISLFRRELQPVDGLPLILWDILAQQIRLA